MKALALIFVVSMSSAAIAGEVSTPVKSEQVFTRVDDVFVAAKLTPAIMKEFKAAGGEIIIDVRDFSEHGECGEAAMAGKLGLKFFMSPLPKADPFTKETIAAVEKIVADAKGKPVLVSCSTGNRAAGFLAAHLVEKKRMAPEKAIQVAKANGLNSDFTEELLREYLK